MGNELVDVLQHLHVEETIATLKGDISEARLRSSRYYMTEIVPIEVKPLRIRLFEDLLLKSWTREWATDVITVFRQNKEARYEHMAVKPPTFFPVSVSRTQYRKGLSLAWNDLGILCKTSVLLCMDRLLLLVQCQAPLPSFTMDSLPYHFVAEVVTRLEPLDDIKKLGGLWKAAAVEEADSRIPCSLCFTTTGIYFFDCNKGAWTLEQVMTLNLKHLRIRKIVVRIIGPSPSRGTDFQKFNEENIPELLSFVSRYFTCGQKLYVENALNPTIAHLKVPLLQSICKLTTVRDVTLCNAMSQSATTEALLQVLNNANPVVLMFQSLWSLNDLSLVLEKWPETSLREVRTHQCVKELDMELLKHIYQLWKEGFFVGRLLDAQISSHVPPSGLDSLIDQPTVGGADEEWRRRLLDAQMMSRLCAHFPASLLRSQYRKGLSLAWNVLGILCKASVLLCMGRRLLLVQCQAPSLSFTMDSLPYNFVAEVITRLEPLEDLQKLGGLWKAAAVEEADSRILCTLCFGSCGIYYFSSNDDNWGRTLEQVKKLNLKHLRINQIDVGTIGPPLRRPDFRKFNEENIPELLSFVSRYFTCGQKLYAGSPLYPSIAHLKVPLLQSIYSFTNVRDVNLCNHPNSEKASTESLLQALHNASPVVLGINGYWPQSNLRLILEKWPETSIREVRTFQCVTFMDIELDMELLKHIYQLWKEGFFAKRQLDVKIVPKVHPQLDRLFGEPTVDVKNSCKEWRVEHPIYRTFHLSQELCENSAPPTIRILIV
uniref:F-box domain-containing protein n=1 Tax=Steinernema glaseri TaxID=37863 RepID=A0A1I7Y6P8_9BILA